MGEEKKKMKTENKQKIISYPRAIKHIAFDLLDNKKIDLFHISFMLSNMFGIDKEIILDDLLAEKQYLDKLSEQISKKWVTK